MEKRIINRIGRGLKLTKAQIRWAVEMLGKYDDDCDICYFNLCIYLDIKAT